jgi:hypothetical protein
VLFLEPRDVGIQAQQLFRDGARVVERQERGRGDHSSVHPPSCSCAPGLDERGVLTSQFLFGKILRGQQTHRTGGAREAVLERAVTVHEGQHRAVEFLPGIANRHNPLLSEEDSVA